MGEIHGSVASGTLTTGDLAGNPGIFSDWESNWQPFGSQASTHSTEPHQPGLSSPFFFLAILLILATFSEILVTILN